MPKNKNLIAYCGLYCGDCLFYKGEIADLARDLRKVLRQEKFERVTKSIPFIKHYKECYETLGVMVRLRCKKGCLAGGGNPFCKIRRCAQKKRFRGCWECDEFQSCKKLATLEVAHKDEHIKNIKAIKKLGLRKLLK